MTKRLRIVYNPSPRHGIVEECYWLSDDCLPQAKRMLADLLREEPGLNWRLQCRGELSDWHDVSF